VNQYTGTFGNRFFVGELENGKRHSSSGVYIASTRWLKNRDFFMTEFALLGAAVVSASIMVVVL
jgi:hypothetical protein